MIKINPIGRDIREITVKRPSGEIFTFLTQGATWTKWQRADGTEMLMRYDDFSDYMSAALYPGNTIGPLAGRIAHGRFALGKKEFIFGSGEHWLHSGAISFAFENFAIDIIQNQPEETIVAFKLHYDKKNYPGKIDVNVRYHLFDNEVRIAFAATSSVNTVLNITNHAYFNLDGDFSVPLASHELRIHADKVVLVDDMMAVKEIMEVKNTSFDFTNRRNIVEACRDVQLHQPPATGIDHYFILEEKRPFALELVSEKAQKRLVVETSYPGVVVYSTNDPRDKPVQTGKLIPVHGAIAIEPQFYSNAVNDPQFPSCELKKNERYSHFIHYRLEDIK